MTRRAKWIAAFLSVTVLAIGMEIFAAADKLDDTTTWTDLIVAYVHWEVFALVWGGLFVWTGVHFGVRFWRKDRSAQSSATDG